MNEDGTLKRKADMFTKRTIKKAVAVTSVETATEALALSLNERAKVDLPYMAKLTGKTEEKITEELVGVIFKNPLTDQWESGDEYLSGNVRDKLNTARTFAENRPEFTPNVRALEAVQPRNLEASEIEVRVGATWIEPSDYQAFMVELLHTPWYLAQKEIQVKYSEVNGEWRITGKNADSPRNAFAYATYGTERANAYKILEDTLNLKDVRIYDKSVNENGDEIRVLNKKERMEIERGPEHYQMSMTELERFRNLEWEMQKYPQIQSLKEANLLLGTRRTFGIYQIKDDSPGENYAFMNMSFIESHGMQIKKEDYKLVYVGELLGNMSLDDIFERFNIDRPEDFRGHSLSVSDIVVLNDGEKVTAHFVDSISFEQMDSFLNLEEQVLDELAYEVGERYFAIQRTEEGYDYSFYDEDFRLMDGGVYENDEISIEEAADELLEEEGWTEERVPGDYDQLMEKVEEMDEIVLAEIQNSQGEYKPLAKVEELEEANYNMIDNVLNNMPPKKEPYLEYFAAECDEFHDMGAYEKSTDVNQIAAVYEKYRENPENAYRVCSMGIIYRDPEDSYYDDAEFAIVKGNTVFGNLMDDVRFYGELALIREGIEKIHDALPDYKYVPMRDVREAMYPEKMTTEQLAEALDEIAEAFDPYEYRDNVEMGENTVQEVMLDLRSGNIHSYISYLKDIVDEECDQSVRAGILIERLKAYEPELPKELEPMVYVNFCEESDLMKPRCQKLSELDAKTAEMDKEWYSKRDPKTEEPKKIAKIYVTVYYAEKGEKMLHHFKKSMDIGNGHGGIVSQLKYDNEMKLTDEYWINYQKGKGNEEFQKYMEDLTDMQNHVLPYLQSFCNLEEKGVKERREQKIEERNEGRADEWGTSTETNVVVKDAGKADRKPAQQKQAVDGKDKKLSIHERLEINKKIIQEKQGKYKPERGVDLDVK